MFAIVGDKVVLSAHTGKVVEMNITSRLKKSEVVDTGKQTKTEENVALKRLLFYLHGIFVKLFVVLTNLQLNILLNITLKFKSKQTLVLSLKFKA